MRASAADGCKYAAGRHGCWIIGSSTSISIVTLPPIRYLATRNHALVGRCWFWSCHPPGLDAFNGANDEAIIRTRFENPQCPARAGNRRHQRDVAVVGKVPEPFGSRYPHRGSDHRWGSPTSSLITTNRPTSLNHPERLPDGRLLEVQAYVGSVRITWGDGSRSYSTTLAYGTEQDTPRLEDLSARVPGAASAGPNCHPMLEHTR